MTTMNTTSVSVTLPSVPRSGDPFGGQVTLTHHHSADAEWLTVERADPCVLISDALLTVIAERAEPETWGRWLRLDLPVRTDGDSVFTPDGQPRSYTNAMISGCIVFTPSDVRHEQPHQLPRWLPDLFVGSLLHVETRNRHLIYRIGRHRDYPENVWEASWPD